MKLEYIIFSLSTVVQVIMNDWQWNAQHRTLIISLTSVGGLSPSFRFPLSGRGKQCYFIKKYLSKSLDIDIDVGSVCRL